METEFAFSGGRSGSGPATWGQLAKWDVIRNLGSEAARYNVTGGTPLAPGIPIGQIAVAVQQLVLMHDSLRTRVYGDGQQVLGAGAVPVVSRQSPVADVTENAFALYFELQGQPFGSGLPVRVGLIEADGLVRYIIFSLPHTASDGWGLRNLLADFASLLDGVTPDDARMQPLEEAAFQVSERGQRRDAAARRSWLSKLSAAPHSQFPAAAGLPQAEKFPLAVLNSPALSLASDWVAAKLAVSPSAVLLAAAAATLGRLTGIPEALFQVVVNNRFLPGLAGGVNVIAQEGLFHLAGTGGDFAGLAGRAFGAAMSANRHAYYDKLALDRDIAAVHGPVADYSCVVNDLRGLMPSVGYGKPAPMALQEARQRTALSFPHEFEPRTNVSFALDAQDAPGSMELAMTADAARMPRPDMERFLYGIEDLVVNQALELGYSVAP